MKPVITRDEAMLKKTDEEIFYSDFKSMWYSMNTKQDSTTKIYNQKIKICLEDIYHLNDIVISKLKQYHNQGLIVSVNEIMQIEIQFSLEVGMSLKNVSLEIVMQ